MACNERQDSYSAASARELPARGCRGVMGPNVSVSLSKILDGTSKTIMLGEIRAGVTDRDARGVEFEDDSLTPVLTRGNDLYFVFGQGSRFEIKIEFTIQGGAS